MALGTEGRLDQMAAYFDEQISQEFIQALTKTRSHRTSTRRSCSGKPLSTAAAVPFCRIHLRTSILLQAFEGGALGPMQMTLAELEMRMLHLVLRA
ncbi:MAG: hypothetical protein H7A53_07780 [Akkermansiaceae bacterium]|nr:hypothetical protein [Akkermansiaceae bacterium]